MCCEALLRRLGEIFGNWTTSLRILAGLVDLVVSRRKIFFYEDALLYGQTVVHGQTINCNIKKGTIVFVLGLTITYVCSVR